MALGVFPISRVRSFNGQYHETSFLLLLVPIAPMYSRFVFKNTVKGREFVMAKIQKPGVVKGYMFIWGVLLAFGFIYMSSLPHLQYLALPGVIFGLLALLSLAMFKVTEEEKKQRILFEQYVGINALPEWLTEDSQKKIFRMLLEKLPSTQRKSWKSMAEDELDTDSWKFLYVLSSYDHALHPSAETKKLFERCQKKCFG